MIRFTLFQVRIKDKIGEVLKVNPNKNTLIVSGVNIVTKHIKPNRQNMQGV